MAVGFGLVALALAVWVRVRLIVVALFFPVISKDPDSENLFWVGAMLVTGTGFVVTALHFLEFQCPRRGRLFYVRITRRRFPRRICAHCGLPRDANDDSDLMQSGKRNAKRIPPLAAH
jgi:hypothetical protein